MSSKLPVYVPETDVYISDDEMPQIFHQPVQGSVELKEEPQGFRVRPAFKPNFHKHGVRLHGGMTVKYSHGWLLHREFVLMYSMIQEVCYRLHGAQDPITRLIMPFVFCGCCKFDCHDKSLLPWLPPYATHEARMNGVLIKRNFDRNFFRAGLEKMSDFLSMPPFLKIGRGYGGCPDQKWYSWENPCGEKIWEYNGNVLGVEPTLLGYM